MSDFAKDTNVPTNDCISRQAAIEIINKYDFSFPEYMERFVTELRDAMKADLIDDVKKMPSAEWNKMNKLCKDCEYFRIRMEYKNEYEWGMAECTKHNLVTDFRSKKKFKTLSCIEDDKGEMQT